MQKISLVLAFGVLSGACPGHAREPDTIHLGLEREPQVGTVHTITSQSVMEGGLYVGVRNRVPSQWGISNRETRVMQVARPAEASLEVKVIEGKSFQSEKVGDTVSSEEKPNPLIGQTLIFRQEGEKWILQRKDLRTDLNALRETERITTRLNNRFVFFGDATVRAGESWSFNPEGIIRSAGFPDAQRNRGEGTARLVEVKGNSARIDFALDASFSVQNDHIASARLDAKLKGSATLDAGALTYTALSLDGELSMMGEAYEPDLSKPTQRIRSPFEYRFPVRYQTKRSVEPLKK